MKRDKRFMVERSDSFPGIEAFALRTGRIVA
jgi:hypothetical protein